MKEVSICISFSKPSTEHFGFQITAVLGEEADKMLEILSRKGRNSPFMLHLVHRDVRGGNQGAGRGRRVYRASESQGEAKATGKITRPDPAEEENGLQELTLESAQRRGWQPCWARATEHPLARRPSRALETI